MGDNSDADAAKRHRHPSPTSDGLHNNQSLPFLPDELIFEILSWLPVSTLLQFKRVCKSWETLISNPKFAKNHLQNITLNPTLTDKRIFYSWFHELSSIISFPMEPLLETPSKPTEIFEFNIEQSYHIIIGSCNGLLCLFDKNQDFVKLLNPCIRFKSKKISPTLDCYDHKCRMRSLERYGFGYDHVNDKYKVLISLSRDCAPMDMTKIYTFGENCWTTIQNFPCSSNSPVGKFVSGTLNWLVVKSGVGVSYRHKVILSFDLEKETYKELLLPENDGVKTRNHMLGVLRNCLCVCFGPKKSYWNIWVMKKYGVAESWTKLAVISYEQLWNCVQTPHCFMEPLFILENGVVLLSISRNFVLLNLNNGRLDECLLGSYYIGLERHIYYASLVSP